MYEGEMRFLIVHNDEQESGALVQLFEAFGQKAVATWSARDALDYLTAGRFDLVLVDQYIADMYVGTFIEQVLKLPKHPRLAIMKDNRRIRPVKYDKSLGEIQFLDRGQPDQMFHAFEPFFLNLQRVQPTESHCSFVSRVDVVPNNAWTNLVRNGWEFRAKPLVKATDIGQIEAQYRTCPIERSGSTDQNANVALAIWDFLFLFLAPSAED